MVDGRQSPVRVAFIGECMIELSHDRDGGLQQGFGGDSLNAAVYLARLSDPTLVESHYVTALGQDSFSAHMLAAWQDEGVHCQHVIQLQDKLPGLYSIQVDQQGERTFHYWRHESAAKELMRFDGSDQLVNDIANFDVIYLSGISLAILAPTCRDKLIGLLALARKQGAKVVFDSNYRPLLWSNPSEAQEWYAKLLPHCDIALLTFDDEQLLYGDTEAQQTLDRTHGFNVAEVILKRGAKDCIVSTNQGLETVAALKVATVIDTTAAGDSFNGAYLAARLTGAAPADAAKLGHQTAATVIQHPGALAPKNAFAAFL